jgi:hypothetical protein
MNLSHWPTKYISSHSNRGRFFASRLTEKHRGQPVNNSLPQRYKGARAALVAYVSSFVLSRQAMPK